MSSRRPLFYKTIADLEKIVEEGRLDGRTLETVMAELKHRDTDRASRLGRRITTIQQGLELDLAPTLQRAQKCSPRSPISPIFSNLRKRPRNRLSRHRRKAAPSVAA